MIKHTCPHCQGQRIVTMKSDLSVDIDRGLPEGSELTFEGEADESPDWVAGDLIIRVRSRRVQGAFTRKNEHLYWKQPISIAEALLGFEHTIEHFDGHTVKLASNHGETTQPGFVQILHGEGLPRLHSSDCQSRSSMPLLLKLTRTCRRRPVCRVLRRLTTNDQGSDAEEAAGGFCIYSWTVAHRAIVPSATPLKWR